MSMEFSRQEYWSGWPFPSPGDLLHLEIKPRSLARQADSLPSEPPESISSVQFSHSVMSDSLRPHRLQHARPPCPSPTPGVYSKIMSTESVVPSNQLIYLAVLGLSCSISALFPDQGWKPGLLHWE